MQGKANKNYSIKRMTKKIKKGTRGEATQYITRSKAIKKLQLSLKDFRRLCILKGIYPREPKKKTSGTNKTYFHVKDINYLSHEKLLSKFREIRAHLKKYKKAVKRGEFARANKLKDNEPKYTVSHLVKERYPTFQDALADLDDPLCVISLFGALPSHKGFSVPNDKILSSKKLYQDFLLVCILNKALRKVFLSVKGIYYQVELNGIKMTWISPYKFAQDLPADVNYSIMMTFLEFYETLMKFTTFRLFSEAGITYPKDLERHEDEGIFDTILKLQEIQKISKKEELDERFKEGEDSQVKVNNSIFNGMSFYLSREVPKESLAFAILSFGGAIVEENSSDLTHVITDRDPKFIDMKPSM